MSDLVERGDNNCTVRGVIGQKTEKTVHRNLGETFKVTFWISLAIFLAACIVSLVAVPAYKRIFSDGKADYCYVKPIVHSVLDEQKRYSCGTYVKGYELIQHVPWGEDRVLATDIPTSDEVRKEAEKFGCQIR